MEFLLCQYFSSLVNTSSFFFLILGVYLTVPFTSSAFVFNTVSLAEISLLFQSRQLWLYTFFCQWDTEHLQGKGSGLDDLSVTDRIMEICICYPVHAQNVAMQQPWHILTDLLLSRICAIVTFHVLRLEFKSKTCAA